MTAERSSNRPRLDTELELMDYLGAQFNDIQGARDWIFKWYNGPQAIETHEGPFAKCLSSRSMVHYCSYVLEVKESGTYTEVGFYFDTAYGSELSAAAWHGRGVSAEVRASTPRAPPCDYIAATTNNLKG